MQKSSVTVGMLIALLGFQCFTFSEVCIKWLTSDYSAMQMIFFSSVVGLITIGTPILVKKNYNELSSYRFHQHIIRALLGLSATFFCILALKHVSISVFIIITFTAPFIGIVLAYFILNEQSNINRLIATLIGFIGVFIIVDPDSPTLNIGVALALIGTLLATLLMIYTKKISWTESTLSINFWRVVIAILVSSIFLPFQWKTPDLFDFIVLLSIGLFRTFGNLLLVQAFKKAPATVILPLDYSGLIWAMIFGYLIWGDIPTIALYYGATLIILAGLYLAYRENLDEAGIKISVFNHAYRKILRKPLES